MYKTIRQLYEEREKLDRVIASLEELQKAGVDVDPVALKRRGRKSMSAEERMVVSERMKRYWAARRKSAARKKSGEVRATDV